MGLSMGAKTSSLATSVARGTRGLSPSLVKREAQALGKLSPHLTNDDSRTTRYFL